MNALWLPPDALLTALLAGGLVVGGFASLERSREWRAVAAVVLAAFLLRAYAGADLVLHPWDERYHALVAKHLIAHPLTPTLYDRPLLGDGFSDWTSAHVWLHKPPLSLWMMAGSMRLFGVNEWAMRLPDALASSVAVAVTYGIGAILFSPRVALLAAAFQAFNGFLVELAAGRRASDHVDSLLILVVEAAVLTGLSYGPSRRAAGAAAAGAVGGLAYLTKGMSGLVLLPVWTAVRLAQSAGLRTVAREILASTAAALLIAAPWIVYTALKFPMESAFETRYALRHIVSVVEEQGGPPWFYLAQAPRFFGELVFLPLGWAAVTWARGTAPSGRRMALAWLAVPYLLYSAFQTKMPAYVMVAAPAVMLIEAEWWWELRQRYASVSGLRRKALLAALVVLAVLPARQLLEPTGPLERRDRNPPWTQDLRALTAVVHERQAVIFNTAHPIETMFYTPFVAYERLPTAGEVDECLAHGVAVYIFDDGTRVLPSIDGTTVIRPVRVGLR